MATRKKAVRDAQDRATSQRPGPFVDTAASQPPPQLAASSSPVAPADSDRLDRLFQEVEALTQVVQGMYAVQPSTAPGPQSLTGTQPPTKGVAASVYPVAPPPVRPEAADSLPVALPSTQLNAVAPPRQPSHEARDAEPVRCQRSPSPKRRSRSRARRFDQFTPLTAPRAKILAEIEHQLPRPKPLPGNPTRRNMTQYCRYHRTHGHDTEGCWQLRREIEQLVRWRKLERYRGPSEVEAQAEQPPEPR